MKKTLLLLTILSATFVNAQNPTAFSRVRITANTTDNTLTALNGQDSTGEIRKIGMWQVRDTTQMATRAYAQTLYNSINGVAKSGNTFSLDWTYVMAHENMAIKADTSSVYTKAAANLRYKAIGYFPTWSEIASKPSFFDGDYNSLTNRPLLFSGAYNDLSGKPSLFSGSYTDLSNKPTIPTNTNQLTNGAGFLTSQDVYTNGFGLTKTGSSPSYTLAVDSATFMTVTAANTAIATMTTDVNGKVPNSRTISINGVSQDLSANRSWTVTGAAPTFNNAVARSLNTNYTISTTQNSRVNYSVRISYSVTVLVGSTGTMNLQYSTNAGSSWITVSTVSNSLNLGLALTGYNDFNLSGEIPANALVRINSTVTNATNALTLAQEVLY